MTSIKGNIILNGINTVTGILFPMVTFPYAARILMPEGIGVVNFQLSIINYIVLLTSLGIPLYAVKEVAKYRDNKASRDKVTIEIIILSIFLCIIGYIAVWILASYIPQIHKQGTLFYVLSLTIVFNAIGVNWFYQGIEDFKFITIRAIIIRTLSALSLFVFIKNQNDILIYGIITVGATVGNNFINFIHLRGHVNLSSISIRELNITHHIKPTLQTFILNLIISLYVQLNTIMLGFMQGDDAVGYFTAGTRISHIGLSIISSLGTVLLPRCSNLLQNGDKAEFARLIKKSARLTVALSLPMIIGLIILSTPVTILFCGIEFADAIPILCLNAPVILIIGLTNVMGIQILYPQNKINLVIWSVTGGAVANIIFNIMLIPTFGATGAAIATLISETAVLFIQAILGKKYFPFTWKSIFPLQYILATILMSVFILIPHIFLHSYIWQLICCIPIGIIIYGGFLYKMKDNLFRETMKFLLKRHFQ